MGGGFFIFSRVAKVVDRFFLKKKKKKTTPTILTRSRWKLFSGIGYGGGIKVKGRQREGEWIVDDK